MVDVFPSSLERGSTGVSHGTVGTQKKRGLEKIETRLYGGAVVTPLLWNPSIFVVVDITDGKLRDTSSTPFFSPSRCVAFGRKENETPSPEFVKNGKHG